MTWGSVARRVVAGVPFRTGFIAALSVVAITIVVPPVPEALAQQSGADIDRAAKRALDDSSIQKKLPGLDRITAPRTPRETPLPPARPPPREDGRATVSGIGSTMLWVLAAVAGLALLYFVLRELRSFRRGTGRRRFDEVEATALDARGREDGPPRDRLLEEADALAARGDFGEAIHLILMHSLRRLESVGEQVIGRSLTAREIVRGSTITARARELLGAIVGASELAHFAGRPADAAAYQDCREAYRQFSTETGAAS